MQIPTIAQGADLLVARKAAILEDWVRALRMLPSAAGLDTPTLQDHVPMLLGEMADAMHAAADAEPEAGMDAPDIHGRQRFDAGFDLIEVVAEFNLLRECIRSAFEAEGFALAGRVARIVHRLLDMTIGGAILSYKTTQDGEAARRRHEYLSFLAHDLRSPLGVIMTATSVLNAPGVDAAMSREMLDMVRDNVYRIDALVSEVLQEGAHVAANDGVSVVPGQVGLRALVQELLDSLSLVARQAGVQFDNRVPAAITLHADPKLLARVFQNLLVNALRHAPGGAVVVDAVADDAGVHCHVRDSGPGIDTERLQRIFDKGERGSDSRGLGFGLAIARNYVRAHGGELHAESVPGHGATFRFDIPKRDAADATFM